MSVAAKPLTNVKIVRSVQPPSQPPPAGGRSRVPAPSGGGSGRRPSPCPRSRDAGGTPALPGHVHRALCAMRMTVSREHKLSERGVGKPAFPTPPPAGGPGPHAGVWGNPVSPDPHPVGAQPSQAEPFLEPGRGETGFPHAPAPQGNGETGFPQTPIRGRVWESKALPGTTVGRPRSRVRGKRSHSLATIVGRGMKPRSFNLSRISSMDFCPRLRTESRAFSSICSTCPTRVISARFRQL